MSSFAQSDVNLSEADLNSQRDNGMSMKSGKSRYTQQSRTAGLFELSNLKADDISKDPNF
jgi:hypothetical protein